MARNRSQLVMEEVTDPVELATARAQPIAAAIDAVAQQAHPKDVPILAAAIACRADILATFNVRHFNPRGARPLILQPRHVVSRIRAALSGLLSDVSSLLRELCARHGRRFQGIDLRWGVRQEAALTPCARLLPTAIGK